MYALSSKARPGFTRHFKRVITVAWVTIGLVMAWVFIFHLDWVIAGLPR